MTPPSLPEWSFIRTVEPSPHDAATVYVAATRYKLDDATPYLFKSSDYGETWVSIVGEGLPSDDFVRVIRVDPGQAGVLYIGTEVGLYVSLDDGATWLRWRSNLPVTPVYDLQVKGSDLVIATHGRSFWILDDLTPLHQLAKHTTDKAVLFQPRRTWRLLPDIFGIITGTDGKDYSIGLGKAATYIARRTESGLIEREFLDAGEAAPPGAIIYYYLAESLPADSDACLSITDDAGDPVRRIPLKPADYDEWDDADKAVDPGPWMPSKAGVNRFIWDARHPVAERLRTNKTAFEAERGPLALPGGYQVELTVNGETLSERFELVKIDRELEVLHQLLATGLGQFNQTTSGTRDYRRCTSKRTSTVGFKTSFRGLAHTPADKLLYSMSASPLTTVSASRWS